MRKRAIVGLGLLGVLAGCSGGSEGGGTGATAPPGAPPMPTSSPSATATAPPADAGEPSAEGGAGGSDAQAGGEGGGDAGPIITVTGLVLGYDVPLAYTPVSINGRPPIFTDATGKFSADGVTTPYDLTVSLGGDFFLAFRGLTNPAPTVSAPSGILQSATLDGFITDLFGPGSTQTGVLYVTPAAARQDNAVSSGSFGFSNDVTWAWSGAFQQDVDVYTLSHGTDALGKPAFSSGHAQATVQPGQTTSNVMITETRLTQAEVTGTITLPSGYAVLELTAAWAPRPLTSVGTITFLEDGSGSTSFDLLAPQAGTIVLTAYAALSDGSSAAGVVSLPTVGGSPVTLAVPQAPQVILPIDGAAGVASTDRFSWGPTSGLSMVFFSPTSGRNAPTVYVVTEDESCAFPDLSAFGVSFPLGASYDWQVDEITGMGPHPVDTITTGETDDLGLRVGAGNATSFLHKFTTAQ